MGLGQAQTTQADGCRATQPGRRNIDSERGAMRERLLARVRADIIPGLEALVDPAASHADLLAIADRRSSLLRTELERADDSKELFGVPGDDPTCAEEHEWVRGHLHDTALQILEFIAGDAFGQGLSPLQIARLAGGAARDLHRWVDSLGVAAGPELLPELELITEQARSLDSRVSLVVGEIATPPTSDQVEALAGAVREAVTNARKHASASHVIVRVECDSDGRTAVTVRDDGIGLDLEEIAKSSGLGVKGSIVGRMKRVGGHASVEDAPGGGTLVTLVTPRPDG